jgi:glycosyltransferase involved in cell wall biosynthesis
VVSEDGSTDRTCEIVQEYIGKNLKIRLLHSDERLGKGGGIIRSIENVSGEIVIFVDADLSTPPTEIPKLLKALSAGFDLAVGSRALPRSMLEVKPPIQRVILGKLFNMLFRLLFRIKIYDTQCGFKAAKREVFENLFEEVILEGFAFNVDLIVRAVERGYRVKEVPIVWRYQPHSKVDVLNQIFFMGKDLLMVWFERKKREPAIPSNELLIRKFYDKLPGDSYEKASRSLFPIRSI